MVQLASGRHVSDRLRSVRPARSWVTTVARLVLGGVLIVAGALKIGAPALSVEAVRAYQLLPDPVVKIVGYGLPALEIIVGVLLVIGLLTRPAAVIAGVLMIAFVVGISSVWARGLRIDCGCFGGAGTLGQGEDPHYFRELLRDFGLVLCASWIVMRPPGRFAMDSALGLAGTREPYLPGEEEGDER
ncbi:putative membrane protein YphA (DoxX/SURF4 family) [Planotetraspora sp. GP83]